MEESGEKRKKEIPFLSLSALFLASWLARAPSSFSML
jgi:hypothetical protein